MKYKAIKITNEENKHFGKWGACYKSKGKYQFFDRDVKNTEAEAKEHCLIAELLDYQNKMLIVENKLIGKYGWSNTSGIGDKYIGDLLA